jgi:4-hydroxybenzoyl-CoA reductase subunit alpha
VPLAYGAPAEGFLVLGARGRKADSIGKATGAAIYTDDIVLPRMAHGKILRSPHAHARIRGIDTSAAEALPGVFAVITGKRAPDAVLRHPLDAGRTRAGHRQGALRRRRRGRCGGVDEDTAIRALELVRSTTRCSRRCSTRASRGGGAALVHDADWKGRPRTDNVCKEVELAFGDVDAAFASASAAVEGRVALLRGLHPRRDRAALRAGHVVARRGAHRCGAPPR